MQQRASGSGTPGPTVTRPGEEPGTILIVDDHEPFCINLGRSFQELGFSTCVSTQLQEAEIFAETSDLFLIVTELRLQGCWAFDFVDRLRARQPHCPVAIATVYPSVATAVRAVQMGFAGYLGKPVSARMILDAVSGPATPAQAPDPWPTLDRTIWEYINQVFVVSGTMAETARRLGLDRRSLRRMLAKHPPMR
jgi:two-component system, response regulator RegA